MERITGLTLPILTSFVGLGLLIKSYYVYGGILLAIGVFLFIVRFQRRKRLNGKYF